MRKLFSALISMFSIGFWPIHKALASDVFGINDLAATNIALGSRSIEDTVAGIINIFLGFLGVLAVLIILYGGFLWMTSQGNADKVQRAKLLIISAVIGLVIIVSAYAISRFVLQSLYNETGAGSSGGGSSGGGTMPGNTGCVASDIWDDPSICSLNRTNGPAGVNLEVYGYHFDVVPAGGNNNPDGVGMVQLVDANNPSNIYSTEVVMCGDPVWYDQHVRVRIPDDIPEGVYDVFLTNDAGNQTDDVFSFVVTPGIATLHLDCLSPDEAHSGTSMGVQATGTGFTTDTEQSITMDGWDGTALMTLDNTNLGISNWIDTQIDFNVPLDPANLPNAISGNVTVTVGAEWDSLPFTVLCDTNADCATGCCYADYSCQEADACNASGGTTGGEDAPVIESITPEDGAVGNLITIYGYNFGTTPGFVHFESPAAAGYVDGDWPSALGGVICADLWTDNYIIIGVPADAIVGVGDVTVVQNGTGFESDPYPFERNDSIDRPSICALSDSEGYYQQDITINGIGFQADDEAYFDTVPSYQTNVTDVTPPGTSATAEVPNIAGTVGVTMQTTAGESSNPYPFTVLASSGGNPIINEISPAGGPVGQYITIMGSGFGSSGEVRFDPAGINALGDTNFPQVCGSDFWTDSQILVKVPDVLWPSLDTDYGVVVIRGSDSAISDQYQFEVQSGEPNPGICAIDPNNGPAGLDGIDVFGEYFGNAPGSVFFYNNQSAGVIPPASWNDNEVLNLTVPTAAVTGPLHLTDAGGTDSNDINFAVGQCQNTEYCQGAYGAAYVCCPDAAGDYCTDSCGVAVNSCYYSWEVYTQADPFGVYYGYNCNSNRQSPSPWPDGHEWIDPNTGFTSNPSSVDAFVDANLTILFTRDAVDADLQDSGNFLLYACNFDPDLSAGFVPGDCEATALGGSLDIVNHNSSREGMQFDPTNNLDQGRWYRVVVGSNDIHAAWGGDIWNPATEGFDWYFRTRNDANICEVSDVVVSPQRTASDIYPGSQRDFYATPIADNCNICGGSYDWTWDLGPDPAPIANYASLLLDDAANQGLNIGHNILLGGPQATQFLPDPNYATINTQNLDFATTGDSQSMILAPVLRLLDFGPNCDDSCMNASVWANFSTQLQEPIDLNQIAIYRCTNTDCSTYDNGTNYTNGYDVTDGLLTILHNNFTAGENYTVILSDTLTNIFGYPLGDQRSWHFSVGDQNCQLSGAYIRPDGYTATNTNDIRYTAYPYGESGMCGASAIQCDDATCNYTWASDSGAIATIDTGTRQVYAHPNTLGNNGTTNITVDISGDYGPANANTDLNVNISGGTTADVDLHAVLTEPMCEAVCTTALVRACFDRDITSLPGAGFSIMGATSGEHFVSASIDPVELNCVDLAYSPLDAGDSYTVTVPMGIQGAGGSVLRADVTWPFGTGDSECFATGASVSPDYRRITTPGGQGSYQAYGTWSSPACSNVAFDCTACSYNWSVDNAIAAIVGSNTDQSVVVQDNQTTDAGTANVIVNLTNENGDAVAPDSGVFEIDTAGAIIPFNLIGHQPNCDGACNNAEIIAIFDSNVRTDTVAGNYHVYDETDGNNDETGTFTMIDGRQILIGHDDFQMGHVYRVDLDGDMQNTSNSYLNNGAGDSFTFTVGAADCAVDRAVVEPQIYTAGASELINNYTALPVHDSVACGAQPIDCPTCSYNWFFGTPGVAVFSTPNNQVTDVTTNSSPPLVGGETTEVNVTVAEGAAAPVPTDPGDLNISIAGPTVYPTPEVVDINPDNLETGVCLNIAPNIEFSETMDRTSISSQGHFYEDVAGVNTEIAGTWTFRETTNGTQAIFNPSANLNSNSNYWVSFGDTNLVVSINGMPLDPTGLVATPIGGLGWTFQAGDHICQIHSVDLGRSDLGTSIDSDLFTCAGINTCVGDSRAYVNGNQHTYDATVYDISGAILSGTFLDYTWNSTPIDANVLTLAAGDQQIDGTAQPENGKGILSVDVENPTDDPGHVVSDSATVQVALCEEPWPSLSSYPWTDTESPSSNFSTYYCQYSGLPNDIILPYLSLPSVNYPGGNVYREFISTINYLTAKADGTKAFGSLAYYDEPEVKDKESVWEKITKLFNKPALATALPTCAPVTPHNFAVTFDGVNAHLSWTQPHNQTGVNGATDHYTIQRMLIGDETTWQNYAYIAAPSTSWTDPENLEMNREYRYRMASVNESCETPNSGWAGPISLYTSSGSSIVDIIGIRVMQNPGHLSVMDWYLKNAPNPSQVGSLISVDGYDALKVGNTIYIGASNVSTNNIFSNIYIIAHNIGARPTTVNIYNQLVNNFKLNINITNNSNNVCAISGIACTTDYDCGAGDHCNARKLKLRRDTKRLGDLVSIQQAILSYGQAHSSCSYDSSIACSSDSDCPGGTCRAQYPLLNAGSYLQGTSNSRWPSWGQTLGNILAMSIPSDPVNLFNIDACSDPYNPDTCWSDSTLQFFCPDNSLIYYYNALNYGRDFTIRANFEYDMYDAGTVTFADRLSPNWASLYGIYPDLGTYCDDAVASAPGASAWPSCGNGIVDTDGYCSISCTDCDNSDPAVAQNACLNRGGRWIIEECDGNFWPYACSQSAPGADPIIPTNGAQNWWNERTIGCYPPGSVDPDTGQSIGCQWYPIDRTEPPFTDAQCGGYCGDGTVENFYENCDGSVPSGYTCDAGDSISCNNCTVTCSGAGGSYPAALCGDGIWTPGVEECDPSANPNGLSGWDCTDGGSARCNNNCTVGCTNGDPYAGSCGDGEVNFPEEQCDYSGYSAPLPAASSDSNTYGCTNLCTFDGTYCGDGVLQYDFQETCDWNGQYVTPNPAFSSKFSQYECRNAGVYTDPDTNITYGACTATLGGWCGDGTIQNTYGEECDPNAVGDQLAPQDTTSALQYSCDDYDCVGRVGGYCGDGEVQSQYGEICDGLDYPDRPTPAQSGINNTYACDMTDSDMRCQQSASGGGYCGDHIQQSIFGESCDWNEGDPSFVYPWPRQRDNVTIFSDPSFQYECNDCSNTGGYCGDGIVQSYEDCDTGFDPAYEIPKDVDIVYIFDMSASLQNVATQLCTSAQDAIDNLTAQGIGYRITIYVLGDNDGTTELTATTTDDLDELSPWLVSSGWLDEAQQVFSNLYTNCGLHQDPTYQGNVRYLSLYDNTSNELGDVSRDGDRTLYGEACSDYGELYTGEGDAAGRVENWGYAMTKIIEDYDWLAGYQRILIPISDEGGYCGSNGPAIIRENENCTITPLPPGTEDVLVRSINLANTQDPVVHINPVLLSTFQDLSSYGECIANPTGGVYSNTTTNWTIQTMDVINSTFCDGNGDGHMDCTLPPNP